MSTGQKYSGKGDSTTPTNQNGSNLEPTANSATQAVLPTNEKFSFEDLKYYAALSKEDQQIIIRAANQGRDIGDQLQGGTPEDPFDFNDLLTYATLTESAKIIADALATKSYSPDQLKRAINWLAKTPDSASASDKVDGVSLTGILTEKSATEGETKQTALALAQLLSSPDLSLFNHNLLLGMLSNGASDDLVLKTGKRLIEFYPHQVPTQHKPALAQKVEGDNNYDLTIYTSQRHGTSGANILAFALEEYYSSRMKEAFNEVRSGSLVHAHEQFQDAETARTILFEMLLEANNLADKNYHASKGEEQNKFTDDSAYHHFLRDYMKVDPATYQEA